MLNVRHSPDIKDNSKLRALRPRRGEGNKDWLERTGMADGVLLIGGSSVVEFRIRVAQARLRQDLFPSFWSMAGILRNGTTLDTVADLRDLNAVPRENGVQSIRFVELDDPERYPNLAIIQFTDDHRAIRDAVRAVRSQRSLVDIPPLIVAWLAFMWGAGNQGNPLVDGKGLPSAVLVESSHALAGIELTPGLSSEASCPEAIWQAAKWWTSYYRQSSEEESVGEAAPVTPAGRYVLRQPAASVVE